MKLADLPPGIIDWNNLPETRQWGEVGEAISRSREYGPLQLRQVDYRPGYIADHWCNKGHILFVLTGSLVIEHQDGRQFDLSAGMTWHVGDDVHPAHRVICRDGARVFIVD
ncbi:MAG: DHCW motif cupin fold protein [Alphaproteobacteria bacterium]|nr:DHCW motif cupin fold protein [Alphaproteobacteria bacterium]